MESAITKSINDAENGSSQLNESILKLEGMSGTKTRHFYNNLLKYTPNPVYLEIGTWKGSSVCSAMYNNNATVVCIDNWSQFSGPKSEFLENFNKYKGQNNASFIENDSFKVDLCNLPTFNIYMYDGDHLEQSHYLALTYYYPVLAHTFIYIVDDWNWLQVRKGTADAIKSLNLKIVYCREIRTSMDESVPPQPELSDNWWNGIAIFILAKD
jgi:hypothetical protein